MYDHCDSRTVLPRRAEERDREDLRTAQRSRADNRTAGRRDRRSKHGRSSSSSSDDGSGKTVTRSRKDYIRPQKFSGTGSFETFYAHFQNCAAYNRWTEKDQLAHLKACLTSDAGQVLWDSSPEATDTLQKLTDLLKNRFGAVRQQDKYRMELRLRRRRSQETLSTLHQDVRRLMALAYPNLEHSSRETLACDYFIDALDDADFALKVRERMPVTLDDALRYALQLEAWMKNADQVRGQNRSSSQDESVRHKLKGRGATGGANEQQLDVGRLAEMIESAVERSINGRLNTPKSTVTERLENSRVQDDGHTTSVQPVITVTNPKWPARRNDRPSYACFQCGEIGHLRRECPQRNAGKVKQEQPTSVSRGITGLDCHNVYLKFRLNGQTVPGLLDTGCEITLVPKSLVKGLAGKVRPSRHREMMAANNSVIEIIGEVTLPLYLGDRRVDTIALISPDVEELMIGAGWLKEHHCVWSFGSGHLSIDGQQYEPMTRRGTLRCRRVYTTTDVAIPARHQVDAPARATIVTMKGKVTDQMIDSRRLGPGVYVGRTILPGAHRNLAVRLVNTTNREQKLPSDTFLGPLLSVDTSSYQSEDRTVFPAKEETEGRRSSGSDRGRPTAMEKLIQNLPGGLTTEQRKKTAALLTEYEDVFSKDEFDLGRTTLVEHTIDTGDRQPIRQPLRRHPVAHLEIIDQKVTDMLQHDIIEPAASPWASNVVLVRKKNGEYRFCVDYRGVNSVTYQDSYPLPHIETCLNSLDGSSWFSTLDLRSGYHNIPIKVTDRDKTAFITRRGCWRYKVLPFGLTCAPSVFQRLMDLVLCGLSYQTCMVYLDDIIVFAPDFDGHLDRLEEIFQRLRSANLKLHPGKCSLLQRRVAFLGHVVSATGIEVQAEKTDAVKDWPVPRNLREVRSFVGLCSYYRRFVAGFADIAAPLHALTRKNAKFEWTAECQQAFDALKEKLTTAPVLGMPQNDGQFLLDTYASDNGLGAVLSQIQGDSEVVIAYASRMLSRSEKTYCTTKKELLAVVYGLKTFKQYLLGRHFTVRTDHSALTWLRRTPEPLAQQARWLNFIEQFAPFDIGHRSGSRHANADALSRRPHLCKQCDHCDRVPTLSAVSRQEQSPKQQSKQTTVASEMTVKVTDDQRTDNAEATVPKVTEANETTAEMTDKQKTDPEIGAVIQLRLQQEERPPITEIMTESEAAKALWSQWELLEVRDGRVYRRLPAKGDRPEYLQLVVPTELQKDLMRRSHTHMCAGHLGFKKTAEQVQRRAYWVGWRRDVERFCRQCDECNRYHRGRLPKTALLQPIVTGDVWERLSVDLTGPHPRTKRGSQYILTCIDHFSKWAEAFPIPNKEAVTVARVLVEQVFCRMGTPLAILTDQGKEVDGQLMREVCRLLDIEKQHTSTYKASTNCQVERLHRTVNGCLLYTSPSPRDS